MLRIIVLLFVTLPFITEAKPKVCLNMIVKNESKVIKRCLDSVKKHISYWVIVDTGSTDGTQKIIKEHLKGIPGELHERPWKNFGENRTEAFQLAKSKGDYLLFMDADDILEFDSDFTLDDIKADMCQMWRGTKDFTYLKPQLAKTSLPWKWVGVTHEYLDCPQKYTSQVLEKVRYITISDGASYKDLKAKFLKNVQLLEEGLKKEPNNARYAFYLAESYRDAGEKGKAIEAYQKRINMGGWPEEVFWSHMQIAHLLKDLGLPPLVVAEAYWNAFRYRSHRKEPIYYLAELYNGMGNYLQAHEVLKGAKILPQPEEKDKLFNMDWIENYGLLFQLSICTYYLGYYQDSLDACNALLAMEDLPANWRKQAEKNRTYPLAKLEEAKKPKNKKK